MQIFLVKNPVGFDLTLDLLAFTRDKFGLAILINDKIADGKDVSWLWDSKIEKLAALENVKHIYISGERALDMDLRIKYSGTNKTTSISNSTQELLSEFASGDTSDIKVIATYTAMNQFRDSL